MNFDYIIIGTGQSTGTLLGKLIPTKKKIAVIEANVVGGSCVNYGCTPTKTMVAAAKAFHIAGKGKFYGFSSSGLEINFPRDMERMNEVRYESRDSLTKWIEDTENVELIRGMAKFTSDKTIDVDGTQVSGDNIFINVGTRPSIPPIKGIDQVPWMDSAKLLELKHLPKHLIIIGGGYIGVEFAQVFKRFGSEVTIIQSNSQLMPREDADVAHEIAKFLRDEGVDIRFDSRAESVKMSADKIELTLNENGKQQIVTGSHLLVAAGRKPNSDTLDLGNAGIKTTDRGFIEVDEFCRTNIDGVFALGDVNGQGAFTHTSVNDAEIVTDFLFSGTRSLNGRTTIYGLFTDPPLGRVGLSEKEAVDQGYQVLKATKPMAEISRAKEMGETTGFAKLIVDGETDLILGAAILGPGGDEIINMFAAIIHSNIQCKKYREVVLVHPTVSELMPWVLDGLQPVE